MNNTAVISDLEASMDSGRGPGLFTGAENLVLTLILAAMIVLPVAEVVLRQFYIGIESVGALVQHLTLAVASIGAAIAAREDQLLRFAAVQFVEGRPKQVAKWISNSFSAGICAIFCAASVRFVLVEREGGVILAYGIPTWVFELVQPLGFALITWRLVHYAADVPAGRVTAALSAAVITGVVLIEPIDPALLVIPALTGLFIATLLGAPIFVAVGGAAMVLLWGDYVPLASLAVNHYSIATNPSLPAIPMFTLAGYFLAESRAPERLLAVFKGFFGHRPGGATFVTVLAATFFTCFTGASGVTILALGGLVMPLLLDCGLRRKHAIGLITGGGSAGVLLMPALPLVLYAIVAQVDIEAMFLAGLLPALLMLLLVSAWGMWVQPPVERRPVDREQAKAALWAARWDLALPLVPIGVLFSGFATPVEAAALTALYAFLLTTTIHRDLDLVTDVPAVIGRCGLVVGGILLILGVALGLTNYMVDAQLTSYLVDSITASIRDPMVFLLALNGFLLFVGCFMDIYSAIVVLVPLIVPLGQAFGINPMHLGLIFLANLELGYLTPPVGMNLFFSALRFEKPVLEVCRSILPIFLLLLIGVLLITYLPFLSTWLPGLLL